MRSARAQRLAECSIKVYAHQLQASSFKLQASNFKSDENNNNAAGLSRAKKAGVVMRRVRKVKQLY